MFQKLGFASFSLFLFSFFLLSSSAAAQSESGRHARVLVTQHLDDEKRVTLHGNTRPEARHENDRGPVHGNYPMDHMLLQLRRSPEQELALQQFLEELHTQGSPNFHQWISAEEFGEKYGVAKQDLDAVTDWLEDKGFKVNVVYTSGMVIDFSGNAAQVRKAFGTDIRHFEHEGQLHIGNNNDPRIPAALAPIIVGIVSLHSFQPHAMHQMLQTRSNFTFPDPFGGNTLAVVPADLATIYNLNPLFSAGFTGRGQTIVLIEDTNLFTNSDWNKFRSTFGLSGYRSGSLTTVHPAPSSGSNNCANPGVVSPNDAEAILDAEWASAAAPNAAIRIASCADTTTTFGGLIALQNLINASSQPPAVMSISYGQCETVNGAAANQAYYSAYQQAVAEGVSVFVASGDSGAAGCDNSVSQATHGIGVNAFASTPYNVAVGGTDFSDTYAGSNGVYWNSTNTSTFGSARSYIPEIPWNDSCAGTLISSFVGYPPYGPDSLCNSPLGGFLATTVAGGGGPSGCATGAPSPANSGIVSGTCQGWAKPSWQSIFGNPSDGVRDTPDISLFAADGLWSHYYVFCWSHTSKGGAACTGNPSGWSGAGGTSFSAPIMAGIQALVNQKTGARQGNPNPAYYQLAAAEYGSSAASACNSSNGDTVPSSCIFYDVTLGDIDVNCTGSANCYLAGGSVGVLSTSNSSFSPAYPATTGWDFATGIGTLNAANLVNNWPGSSPTPSFVLSASPNSLAITQGANGTTTITVTPQSGFNGNVSLSASGLPSGVSASFNPTSATSTSTLTLTASSTSATGTVTVTITGNSGSLSSATTISLTVNPTPVPNFTISTSPSGLNITQGATGTSTITVIPQNGFNGNVSLSASGLPSGVSASFAPTSTTSTSTLTLTATSTSATGTVTVTITGTSGSLSNSTTVALTVNPIPVPSFTTSASPSGLTIVQGATGTSTITVTPQNGFNGNVSLSASGLPSGVSASFTPTSTTSTSALALTASSTATTGTVTVIITGTSGSLSNSTTVALTVTVNPAFIPDFTLSASPSSMTIAQGASGSSTITLTPQNSFNNSVSLSASGLPSGVTASFSPNPATSTSALTLTASTTATIGMVTVTITGTSGSLSHSTSISLTVQAPVSTLPSVWSDSDVGTPGVAGNANYANNVFTVNGAGTQIYGTADAFHFVYQPLLGDGTIAARLVSLQGGSGYVSAGVMIREALSADSTNAKTADWAAYRSIYFDVRTTTGGSTSEPGSVGVTLPYWVKVTRSGSTFTSYTSPDGASWAQLATSQSITMGQSAYVGLAVTSGSDSALANAVFDNVSVSSASAPAPVISSLSATAGSIGSQVVISGTGFGAAQGSSMVLLNGTQMTINSWSNTSIGITIPSGATSGPLVVSVAPSMNDSNAVTFTVTSQPLPNSWLDQDVGSVGVAGSASYTSGTFTVKGAGTQIYNTADSFHFVYRPLLGDGTILARLVSLQGGSAYVSAGVMIREALSADSTNAKTADWAAYGSIYFDVRSTTGGYTSEPGSVGATLPYWVKVTRSGSMFTSYTSSDGTNWVQLATGQTITMGQSVYVGLAVTSGSASALATATFDNVSVQ